MTPALAFNGVQVRDRGEMLSLTDMWRAAGADGARRPSEWLRSTDANRFIGFLADTLARTDVGNSHFGLVHVAKGGVDGGLTLAHWQLALAYAKYLSPEFHAACNVIVRERMEGKALVAASPNGEQIERTFGIVRMLAAKVTNMEGAFDRLLAQTAEFGEAILHPNHLGAREVLDDAAVPSSGRRPLLARTTRQLDLYSRQHQFSVRREAITGRKLFHRDAVDAWKRDAGDALIARHIDAVVGQGRLPLVSAR